MAMTPSEMIEVLQHFEAGGNVEFRSTIDDDYLVWQDAVAPAWNFDDFEYRIKPKPLELWVNVYPEPRSSVGYVFYKSEDNAIRFRGVNGRTVHMREVLGD